MNSKSLTHSWFGSATAVALALFLLVPASAKEPPKPAAQVLDVGSYRIEWVPEVNWQSKITRESECVIFRYFDEPARTVDATIAVFRLVVPAPARRGDKIQLAAAYATHDVAGAQKALFNSNARLMLMSKTTKTLNSGQLLSYAESIDVLRNRLNSTKFVRAWVFFPRGYAETGTLYLVLGREQSAYLEPRPSALEKAEAIIAGIRDS